MQNRKYQIVVSPDLIREYDDIVFIDPHLGSNGKAMGYGIGYDGKAYFLAGKGRVFSEHQLSPGLT